MIEEAMAKSEEMKTAGLGQRKVIQEIAKTDPESTTAAIKSWLQEQGS
jgi:flagellar biosynthesis/type III secretory pathway M-ring protein FliF/YscJ